MAGEGVLMREKIGRHLKVILSVDGSCRFRSRSPIRRSGGEKSNKNDTKGEPGDAHRGATRRSQWLRWHSVAVFGPDKRSFPTLSCARAAPVSQQ